MKLAKNSPLTRLIKRLQQTWSANPHTKEELVQILRDAHTRSLLNIETLTMLEGALLFSTMQARDLMLPKNQMTSIAQDASYTEIIHIITHSGHSRVPVTTDQHKNEVVGILHAKDLLTVKPDNEDCIDLTNMIREATFIPESKRLDLLLHEFRRNRNHMAIVVDEYGVVSGFITLEDIIEQIVGDIEDEFDIEEEAYIKVHGNGEYIIKGLTPIEQFNTRVGANFSDADYDTIGGILMHHFGRMPLPSETIMLDRFQFKILNADSRRVKLLQCIDQNYRGEHHDG